MIYLVIILNTILTYLILYVYYKYKGWILTNSVAVKLLFASNFILTFTLYVFSNLFPNNSLRDLFDPDHYKDIIGNNHRYVNEIGESVFSSEPPF